VSGREIEVGFFSFTEITDKTQHRQYNEWHQLDHLPEQYQLEGIVHGERWVSSPRCRAARLVSHASLDAADYVTLYLMCEPIGPTLQEFQALALTLHKANRFFEPRRAILSGPFSFLGTKTAPSVQVTPSLLAFRPNLGVYVLAEEAATPSAPTDALLAVPGVAGVSAFSAGQSGGRWEPGSHAVTVCYLERDALEVAAAIAPVLEAWCAQPAARLAGPFEVVRAFQWDWFD
jgi:hypothetical protein